MPVGPEAFIKHVTGSTEWQKQARMIIISRKKTKKKKEKENCKYPSSFSLDSVLSLEIAAVGVDKQKARLHR